MYVVIGDGNPVFSTDVDDLAWEYCEEYKDEFDSIYVEEMHLSDFNARGKYKTTNGDTITLNGIIEAEQEFRNEELRPKKQKTSKSTKKKNTRKSYRQYLDGQISTMQPSGVKRLLAKLGVAFDENSDRLVLENLLLSELNKYTKNKDDYAEELFLQVNDCANVPLRISQLSNGRNDKETREIIIKFLERLNASFDSTDELESLNQLLFDYIAAEADNKGLSILDTYEELKKSVLGS